MIKNTIKLLNNERGFGALELMAFVVSVGILLIVLSMSVFGASADKENYFTKEKAEISSVEVVLKDKMKKDPSLLQNETPISIETLKVYQENSILYHILENDLIPANGKLKGDFYEIHSGLMSKIGFHQTLKGAYIYSDEEGKVYLKKEGDFEEREDSFRFNYPLYRMLFFPTPPMPSK